MCKRFSTTEWCDNCENENTYKHLKEGTHKCVCKHCGKELSLCTECIGRNNGYCDPLNKKSFCYQEGK